MYFYFRLTSEGFLNLEIFGITINSHPIHGWFDLWIGYKPILELGFFYQEIDNPLEESF